MNTPQLAFALLAILLVVHVCVAVAAAPVAPAVARLMPLDGAWQLALDRADVGVKERWFKRDLFRRVRLPGTRLPRPSRLARDQLLTLVTPETPVR